MKNEKEKKKKVCSTLLRNCVFHIFQDGLEAPGKRNDWVRIEMWMCQTDTIMLFFRVACIQECANMHICVQMNSEHTHTVSVCPKTRHVQSEPPWCG